MKQAIEKALSGGYSPSDELNYEITEDDFGRASLTYFSVDYSDEGSDEYSADFITQDVRFWQALGKALGWEKKILKPYPEELDDMPVFIDELIGDTWNEPEWKYQWHLFIDHLAEGRDADSFFESLLVDSYK